MHLLERLRIVGLPQWRLVAGCLYQTVWNTLTDRARGTGIKDYDLIYYDSDDLSWEAEDAVIRRVADSNARLRRSGGGAQPGARASVVPPNASVAPIHNSRQPMNRCAITRRSCTPSVSGWSMTARLDIVAPFGLDDMFAMVIRPNRTLANAASHTGKAMRAEGDLAGGCRRTMGTA